MYLFKILPKKFTIFVCNNSSVATKKGNKDGTTDVAHSVKPFLTAIRLFFENSKRLNAKIRKIIAKKFLFNFITKK